MKISNFFTCPEGHHAHLPYRSATTAWCDACNKFQFFNPVTPAEMTPEQKERDNEDTERQIQQKFRDYAETYDKAREGLPVKLVAEAKDDNQAQIIARLRSAGFPERHIAGLRAMDRTGMKFARDADDILNGGTGHRACLLWGDYGRGKTQIATGLGLLRAQRGERTRYINAADLIRLLKDNFETKIPEATLLHKYHECACLIVDDLHAALDDDPGAVRWARGQFQDLIDFRYRTNRALRTVLIVNASDATLLNSRIGGHILSRVAEDGKVIHVNAKNYRAKARVE